MARKTVQRHLVPLAEQAAAFRGFEPDENKTIAVERWVRKIALRSRRSNAQPFFATREVASFFGVPSSTVSRVYTTLAKEGLLLCRRSSVTELTAARNPRRIIHRGIVAVPIWLPGFLIFEYWRVFFIELEERLRHCNFVANLIFYRYEEEMRPEFAHRVLSHSPEYFIWLMPPGNSAPILEMITDKGVRPILLGKASDPEFRGRRYILRNERGTRRCLEAWKQRGLAAVYGLGGGSAEEPLGQWIREAGLECHFEGSPAAGWSECVEGLGRNKGAGVILSDEFFVGTLCGEAPRAMGALIRRVPVLTPLPLPIPPEYAGDGRVDLLVHDWIAMARRVAHDLDTGRVFSAAPPAVFEAEWKARVPVTVVAPGR